MSNIETESVTSETNSHISEDHESVLTASEDEYEEEDDGGCLYNFTKDDVDVDDYGDIIDDIAGETELGDDERVFVKPEDRICKPIMSRFELTRVMGDRETHLANGAKPFIQNYKGMSFSKIAQVELDQRVMPMFIIRYRPNGKKEKWSVNELRIKA